MSARNYRPKASGQAYPPEFTIENDLDYTSSYPCGVCGVDFRSRFELANHPHPKKEKSNALR